MLIIRNEQMQVFKQEMRRRFEESMLLHIADRYPIEYERICSNGKGEEEIRSYIKQGILDAASFGIESELGVCLYIELMVQLGPGFHDHEDMFWIREILKDTGLSGNAKVECIHRHLPDMRPAGKIM